MFRSSPHPLLQQHALAKQGSSRDYWQLLKPRVMALVTFTGAIGILAAPGSMHPLQALLAVLAIALGGGASGAFNMWYEADLDRKMSRTSSRPLPAGRIERDEALAVAIGTGLFSLMLMGLCANWLAALWLLVSILIYTLAYTIWLKPRTPQNIVWGGASGALPPVIGWVAAGGDTFAAEPWLLFLLIFLWTPPHFWALSLFKSEEYAAAGLPMLPVVKGEAYTKKQIIYYCIPLIGTSLALPVLGYSGWLYGLAALILGGILLWHANQTFFARDDNYRAAKKLFGWSIVYLFGLFLAYAVDVLIIKPFVNL